MGASNIQSHLKLIKDQKLTINDFKIISIIGLGGFSIVYKAKLKKTGRLFAIKEISKNEISKKKILNYVLSEKNILSELYNPFIINLYCTFQDEKNIYFVMDYLGGGELRYYIIKRKKFNENQIKFILGCIIIGLEYIHSKKIIHRDLKPENLIFDDKGYLHICDFGISIKENEKKENMKKIGTKEYFAPEGNVTYLSDIYSIGIILYEIIFFEFYDKNCNISEINNKLINKNFSKNLIDFIDQLLEKDINKRLGCKNGIFDLINHPFFKDFNFNKLKNETMLSPIFPKFEQSNYIKIEEKNIEIAKNEEINNDDFNNFDYICYNKVKEKENQNYKNIKFKLKKARRSSSCFNIFQTPKKQNSNNNSLCLNCNYSNHNETINQSIFFNYTNNIFNSNKKSNNHKNIFYSNKSTKYSKKNIFRNSNINFNNKLNLKLPKIINNKEISLKNKKLLIVSKLNPFDKNI